MVALNRTLDSIRLSLEDMASVQSIPDPEGGSSGPKQVDEAEYSLK